MATHSSVLAWRIPGTGEPGGLPSMGSHRIGHDWSDLAAAADRAVTGLCLAGSVRLVLSEVVLKRGRKMGHFLPLSPTRPACTIIWRASFRRGLSEIIFHTTSSASGHWGVRSSRLPWGRAWPGTRAFPELLEWCVHPPVGGLALLVLSLLRIPLGPSAFLWTREGFGGRCELGFGGRCELELFLLQTSVVLER